MPVTQDNNSQPSPQANFNNYIAQWNEAEAQQKANYATLMAAVVQMLAVAKEGGNGIQRAMRIAELVVMPDAMQAQGGLMGGLAAGMNIGSAMQVFLTEIQNDMNAGKSMTNQQAQNFVKLLKEFFAEINPMIDPLTGKGVCPPWMDNSTWTNINSAISKICQMFGCSGPNDPNFTPWRVKDFIQYWQEHPTSNKGPPVDGAQATHDDKALTDLNWLNPNGDTGQQCLQNLQAAFTQWNNSESAQSQGLQAKEQFAANVYNQYTNAFTGILAATQKQESSMVQNQKTQ